MFRFFFFFFPPSAASQIITGPLYHPHLTFCGSQPQSRFFFFEFESQPTQTTFTVWQMKLINNLKHALAEAHTIMSLNMFLPAAEMHLNRSPVVHIKGKHNSCCSFTSPYISIISHTPVYTQLRYPLCEASDADSTCRNRPRSICKKRTAGCFSQTWSG